MKGTGKRIAAGSEQDQREWNRKAALEWARTLAVALALFFLILRPFVLQGYYVPTGSMEDNILIGDVLLVEKLSFGGMSPHSLPLTGKEIPSFHMPGLSEPERGEIIVFEPYFDRSVPYVKRCMAVGGDTVEMRDKVLYVNGVRQDELYVRHSDPSVQRAGRDLPHSRAEFGWQAVFLADQDGSGESYCPTRDNFGPLAVPTGAYFCLGDNRDDSFDSRYWGFVERKYVLGRPLLTYFSWNEKLLFPRFDRIGRIIQ